MISTSGYFKSVNCPFFQNGLCERPYCHFRHVKQEIPVTSAKVSSPFTHEDVGGSTFKLPKPESEVHLDLLTMVQKVVEEEKARVLLEVGGFSEPIKYSEPAQKYSGHSLPSKYSLFDGNTLVGISPQLKYESTYKMPIVNSKPVIPEYKPTPIAELQKRMGNKYRLSPKHRVNDMEYDPVSNFTTEFQSRNSPKLNVETKSNHSLKRQYSCTSSTNEKRKKLEIESKVVISPESDGENELQIDAKFSSEEDEAPESPDTFEDLENKTDKPTLVSPLSTSSVLSSREPKVSNDLSIKSDTKDNCSNMYIKSSHSAVKEESNNVPSTLEKSHRRLLSLENKKSEEKGNKTPSDSKSKITSGHLLKVDNHKSKNSLEVQEEFKERKTKDSSEKEKIKKENVQCVNKIDSPGQDKNKIDNLVLDKRKDELVQNKTHSIKHDKSKIDMLDKSKENLVQDKIKNCKVEKDKSKNTHVLDKKDTSKSRIVLDKRKDDGKSKNDLVQEKSKKNSFDLDKRKDNGLVHNKSKSDHREKDKSDNSDKDKSDRHEKDNRDKDKSDRHEKDMSDHHEKDKSDNRDKDKSDRREKDMSDHREKDMNERREKDKSGHRESDKSKKNIQIKNKDPSLVNDRIKKDGVIKESSREELVKEEKKDREKHASREDNPVNKSEKSNSVIKSEKSNSVNKSEKLNSVNKSEKINSVKKSEKSNNKDSSKLKLEHKVQKSPIKNLELKEFDKRLKTSKSEEKYLDKKSGNKSSKHLNTKSKSHSISHVDLFGEDSDDDKDSSTKSTNKYSHKNKNKNHLNSEKESTKNKSIKHVNLKNKADVIDLDDIPDHMEGMSSKSKHEKGSHKKQQEFILISDDDMSPKKKKKDDFIDFKKSSLNDSDNEFDGMDTDFDDHDTYEECLRIFNETDAGSPDKSFKMKVLKKEVEDEDEFAIMGRRRVAHRSSNEARRPKSINNNRPSPAQVLYNRYVQLQKAAEAAKAAAMLSAERRLFDTNSSLVTEASGSSVEKNRVAHGSSSSVGALPLLQKKAKTVNAFISTDSKTGLNVVRRVSHVPLENEMKKPTIPVEYGSKVPTNIRQRYLNVFCDECLKIYSNAEDAFERAKQEEQSVYDRSISRTIYLNVAVNAVKRLRNEAAAGPSRESRSSAQAKPTPSKRTATTVVSYQPANKKMSHEAMLGGAKAAKTNFSVRSTSRNVSMDSLKVADLYKLLQVYILSREEVDIHGFPQVCIGEPGKAIVTKSEAKQFNSSDPTIRSCARCGKTFRISESGHYITKEECVYHWGKAWKKKIAGSLEIRYTCCQGDSESDGCCLAKLHVSDQKYLDNLYGFVTTLPKTPPIDGNFGVYALDCEMCYTTHGAELTRITVIDTQLKPVYESFVKPDNPIVDYNTRFSGITEEDIKGIRTTLRDVQAVLLNKFNDKTILIGHSLESDFMAMKLIHNTIVDTSVVFPHRLGLPYKRALRTLMIEYIKKIIQADVSGHDSREDAAACMELMLWKIKEDIKKLLR